MKILMICDFFHENQLYQENLLTKYYLKKDHEVTILATTTDSIFDYYSGIHDSKNKPITYFTNNYKVKRLKYSINLLNKVRCLKGLNKAINEENPDIIYVHGFMLNLFAAIRFKRANNCKIIYDSHADLSNSGKSWVSLNLLHKFFYRVIIRSLYKKIDRIFYVTPEGGEFLNKHYKIPYTSMDLLPLGSDVDYIEDIKSNFRRKDLRANLGFKESDFIVFTGGKLGPIKRTELLIEAISLLNDSNIHLVIIGKSMDEDYANKLVKLAGNDVNIHFLGWLEVEELYKCLLAADIAIYPASQSVLWQQSIGAGLPLIVGDFSGDAEYLNRNNNIIIMKNADLKAAAISELIIKLLKDRNLYDEMKKGAIITTNGFLSYENIAAKSLDF